MVLVSESQSELKSETNPLLPPAASKIAMSEEKERNECGTFGDNYFDAGEDPEDNKYLEMSVRKLHA